MKTLIIIIALVGLIHVSFTTSAARECRPDEDIMDPPPCPGTGPESTYFPYPYDCRKFYECTPDGNAHCFFCDETLIWDDVLKTCNYESETSCVVLTTLGSTTPTTPTTTTEPTTTTTEPTTTTTTTTTEPPTTTEDPHDPINWVCPNLYVGLIAHPYDCGLFYNCDPGHRPCLFECQQGTYFDPSKGACDYENLVDYCSGGTPPPGSPTPYMSLNDEYNYRTAKKSFLAQLANADDPCVPIAGARNFFGR